MRYEKDGKIAVLLSPYGWYTRHGDWSKVFDPELVQQVIDGQGPEGMIVEWVKPGDHINIVTHHGREKVQILVRGTHWITGRDLDDDKEWMQV